MPKLLSIAAGFLLLFGQAFGQTSATRLLKALRDSKPDSTRLEALYYLGEYWLNRHHKQDAADLDSAKSYYNRELILSGRLKITAGYGLYQSLQKLGEVSLAQKKVDEGSAYYKKIIDHYHTTHDKLNEANIWERFGLSFGFSYKEQMQARQAYKNAAALLKSIGEMNHEILLEYRIARTESLDSAKTRCLQLIAQYRDSNYPHLDFIYYQLSNIYRYKGDINTALFYCLKSVDRMEAYNDTTAAHFFYGELAQVYQALGQTGQSVYYYKKTIALREKMNMRQEFIFRTAGFVAQGLIKLKKPREALDYILGIEQRHPPDGRLEAAIIEQIKAYCYEGLNQLKKAEKSYLSMLADYKAISPGPAYGEVVDLAAFDVAKFYINQKKYNKAEPYARMTVGTSFSTKKEIQYILFQVDSARRDYLAALNHFRNYKMMSDSILNETKSKQVAEMQVKYETDQKEKDIKLLKKDGLIKRAQLQQANNMRNLTLGGIALLILFTGLLFNGYRQKQKSNRSLNALVAEKDHLLQEKDSLLEEKQWLLKEIHHRVKNNLQIVMGLLQRQSAYVNNTEALAAIQNSENRMHSIALIHQKLYQSQDLSLIYMQEYISELITYLTDTAEPVGRLLFEKHADDIYLDVSQAVPLGLILNEAITNAIKYAYPPDQPGLIRVSLLKADHNIILHIADHGRGLPANFDIEKTTTLGMNLIKGLSKQLSGKLELKNAGGLSITLTFRSVTDIASSG